jgi:hypothetical protein
MSFKFYYIGVETVHLVTVVPSNVHSGMPGVNLEE